MRQALPDQGFRRWLPDGGSSLAVRFSLAALAVAAATGLGFVIEPWMPLPNVSIAYLLAVLLVASRLGRSVAIFASVTSFLAFNFFFTEPRFTFAVADPHSALTLAFFLVAAIIVSGLASRLRAQVEATEREVRRTATLYDFLRSITSATSLDGLLAAIVAHLAALLHVRTVILLDGDGDGGLRLRAAHPPLERLDEISAGAAELAFSSGQAWGRGTDGLGAADWLFQPLVTSRGAVGVLGIRRDGDGAPPPEQVRLLGALADQAALAIERTALVADVERARLANESERLRAALLSALSHDLRTPLVSIIGAASSLVNYHDTLDAAAERELAQTIQDEAERLNRFVQNLLDMTRLGAGALRPRADWADLGDILDAAVRRSGRLVGTRRVTWSLPAVLPLVHADSVLLEQAFFNLLDNACKYAPEGSAIGIAAAATDDAVEVRVCDEGPGIAAADRERVFNMFFRAAEQGAGAGLGLAICRGIVEAHGGRIAAEPGAGGQGTCFVVRLPSREAPPIAAAEEGRE